MWCKYDANGCPEACQGTSTGYCGDKICQSNETASSCSSDCGSTGGFICSDGKDNDSDGFIDYPSDTGCYSSADMTETPDGSDCRTYAAESACKSAACTWYTNHWDGTHCDDAAHGGGSTACDFDKVCEYGESSGSCPSDCTSGSTCDNDKICESNENTSSCPGD